MLKQLRKKGLIAILKKLRCFDKDYYPLSLTLHCPRVTCIRVQMSLIWFEGALCTQSGNLLFYEVFRITIICTFSETTKVREDSAKN